MKLVGKKESSELFSLFSRYTRFFWHLFFGFIHSGVAYSLTLLSQLNVIESLIVINKSFLFVFQILIFLFTK